MKHLSQYIILMCFLVLSTFNIQAQFSYSISGIVKDELKEPLPQLGVRILNAQDSSFVKGTTSSEKGRFRVSGLAM